MKSDQYNRYEKLEKHFGKLRQPKRNQIIECVLPGNAVVYLFERATALQIELLVEKRDKGDYVVIEIEEDNKRVYIFQLLLDALRNRFQKSITSIFLKEEQNREINDLFAMLTAH